MNKEKVALLRKLYKFKNEQDAFLEIVPGCLSQVFYDNPHADNCSWMVQALVDAYFGTESFEVGYALYDFKDGYEVDGTVMETIEDYFAWLENQG